MVMDKTLSQQIVLVESFDSDRIDRIDKFVKMWKEPPKFTLSLIYR